MSGLQKRILACEQVTVDFDGFKAINGMDFYLGHGELRFLIGPNGAGKTTMLDVICGKVKPASGRIHFGEGIDISRKKEYQIAELGIGRKFQAPSIFSELTVMENLELAMSQKRGVLATIRARLTHEDHLRMKGQLEQIGLAHRAEVKAGGLSHGEKQWLEIGMMLMQNPSVLLLDEPVAGMTDTETEKTGELLKEIAGQRAVVVVEHDMEFVRAYADTVTVMHEGKLLKEGTMLEVQQDQRVAEVYLGQRRDEHAISSSA